MNANISGKNIKLLRTTRGWGQIELTAALTVDHGIKIEQSDISEIERGVRGVKDFELLAFAKVLGVTTDHLLKND
jgi:transcriptional regulator with XRE-family HTH domain